jgi:hypothetical protein
LPRIDAVKAQSEYRRDSCLFADFVGCDSIELLVSLDWDSLDVVGVNGMAAALSEQMEAISLQITDEITSFDRHVEPL